jgi:AcrR family transcriptional regulator
MAKHQPKDIRRQQFFKAVTTIASKKGYAETSVDDIVRVAGQSKGNFYHHFKSKRELFAELFREFMDDYLQRFLDPEKIGSMSIRDILEASIVEHERFMDNEPDIFHVYLELMVLALHDKKFCAEFKQMQLRGIEACEELLRRGIRSGELRGDMNVRDTALSFWFLHTGTDVMIPIMPDTLNMKKFIRRSNFWFYDSIKRRKMS